MAECSAARNSSLMQNDFEHQHRRLSKVEINEMSTIESAFSKNTASARACKPICIKLLGWI